MYRFICCLFLVCLAQACKTGRENKFTPMIKKDIHSYAEDAVIKQLVLDLEADFENHVLKGSATYQIETHGAEYIVLDLRGPEIFSVNVDGNKVEYKLGTEDPILGQALVIPVKPGSNTVSVFYQTKPTADALQWLDPQQTSGQKHPFLFSQGQAILTRTWIPIQDSPGIRFTYQATIRVPKELMAVMSATNVQSKNPDGVYRFTMAQPVPAYLMALAIGDLAFKSTGPRSGVYAEPSVLEKASWEFGDTEDMIAAAEQLYGPYAWERYDLLVLPPSFPFGGMENPRLTFATPTVIAGDKSLVSLVAHELAHSWSGNLVTNADWNDFWINEGFTTYFERRIMEVLYGREYSEMLSSLAFAELHRLVTELGAENKDSHLHLDLAGRNPDDGMNSIAYEKGYFFIRMIEEKMGRSRFDDFLKKYFSEHAFQTMNSERLLEYMKKNLPVDSLQINPEQWIYHPGVPSNCPVPVSDLFDKVEQAYREMAASQRWDTLVTSKWSSHEWVHFISLIPDTVNATQLKKMDQAYGFSKSGNGEILDVWFEKAIKGGSSAEILASIEDFLIHIGRRKYLMPLYKAFKATGQIETARRIFTQARPNYHSVSANSVEQLLKE